MLIKNCNTVRCFDLITKYSGNGYMVKANSTTYARQPVYSQQNQNMSFGIELSAVVIKNV